MNKTNTNINASNTKNNVMPLPLSAIKNIFEGKYDKTVETQYMQFLQTNLYKVLKPYVYKALSDDDYEGSPIYNGYVDRDTIGTIVDKAIYYAEQDNEAIKKITETIDVSDFSKNALLRSVVQSVVLDILYFEFRANNSDNIIYENDYFEQIIPDDKLPENFISSETLPLPLAE